MSDFDIFPTLDEPETATKPTSAVAVAAPAAPAAVVTSVKAAVLAQFKATEPVLEALVARYANVAVDVSTPKGLAAAKEARHDLRKNGRFVVQNARDDLKAELNALKPIIESEAERLIAMVKPTEDAYDAPIAAREAELAAEKAAREEKEAARVAVHRAGIAKLAGYVAQAQGKTSDQILTVINGVSAYPIIPEQWEEFAVGAEVQKAETLDALQSLYNVTKNAEVEAGAREAQRIENERIAAELAAREAELAAKQAEIDRKLAALAAAEKAEADRIEAAAQAQRDAYAKKVEAEAQALADLARLAAEDEANRLAQKAAAALQELVDIGQEIEAPTHPEQLNDDALAAMPSIADSVEPVEPPAAAREPAEHTGHYMADVSPGLLHPTPEPPAMEAVMAQPWTVGGIEFAGEEPTPGALAQLLAHIDEAFAGKFPSHPKPSPEWWGRLRQLTDEAREHVAA